MSTLFGLNKPNTKLKKNVFDLSEKHLFSSSVGMLLPCMVKECNPGEKFQINLSAFTRTQPLNTSAFVRCRQYYHFFFVPFKQLWSGWDNFINGVNYRTSALQNLDDKNYQEVPSLSFKSYVKTLLGSNIIAAIKAKNEQLADAIKLFDSNADKIFGDEGRFDPDYIYKMLEKKGSSFPMPFNLLDEHGYLYYHGISRLFDMLGFGFNYEDGSKKYRTFSEFLENGIKDVDKLDVTFKDYPIRFNMFRFLAYQKIYNDFYKRDDYEKTNPLAWNIDDIFNGGNTFDSISADRMLEMTRLRYRWSPKDYFTGVVPSELYGLENALSTLSGSAGIQSDMYAVDTQDNKGVYTMTPHTVTTKQIRTAFAIEKLMRLTRRAGGFDYISQTAAHYGFEPPKGRGEKVQFIGGFSNDINISEVVTTSSFSGQVDNQFIGNGVGQIFGKGIGASQGNKEIEFTAPEHGLLMCITSSVPDLDYSAEGLDRFNTKFKRGDYFHPEFQDLGLQPVYGYELYNDFHDSSKRNSVLGFNPMYSEYKTSYDKLHGEFRNGRTLSAWSASSLLRCDSVNNMRGVNISTLKINPKCLDRIFSVNYNGTEMTDQFMTSAQFIIKAIRPMSVTGQNL